MTKKSKSRLLGTLVTALAAAVNLILGGLVISNITGFSPEGIAFAGVLALGGIAGVMLYLINFARLTPHSLADIKSKRLVRAILLAVVLFAVLGIAGFLLRNFALSYAPPVITTYLILGLASTAAGQFISDFFFHPQF